MPRPTIYLIAGSNGAGKTTFATESLRKRARLIRFLNADEIARGLSPLAPRQVALKGGRILLSEVKSCITRRGSFALGARLAGRRTFRSFEALELRVIAYRSITCG
jgi:predicted ABC-type ATPase